MLDMEYKQLLSSLQLKPKTYKSVADDWELKPEEWYHALVSIEDLAIILAIPDIKIYSWCRCKLVASDGSEDHFHWHGLVHFPKIKLDSWRRQARRKGVILSSSKNTFKKIHCLDHAVGVLRYLACSDGQIKTRRDADGLISQPHTHYARQPISDHHRHKRGKECSVIRNWIAVRIAKHLDLEGKPNWNEYDLHDVENCTCARGNIGKKKIKDANEKRRAFYKTERGLAVKKAYKEKAAKKRQIINQLIELHKSSKASLQLETIQNLIKLLP